MSAAIVQSASHSDGSGSSTSVAITLGAAPTVGNLLLYFGSFDLNKTYVGTTSGWTAIGTNPYTNGRAAMSVMYRIVQSGDTASWTFPQITTADTESGALVEVSGQAVSSFINGFIKAGSSVAVTANTGGSVTPTVLNCLAIGYFAEDTGAGGTQATDIATVTSGWSFDQRPYPDFHPGWLVHKTALTADTTTAITATVSSTSSSANSSIIVLIAPASGAPSNTGAFFRLF